MSKPLTVADFPLEVVGTRAYRLSDRSLVFTACDGAMAAQIATKLNGATWPASSERPASAKPVTG